MSTVAFDIHDSGNEVSDTKDPDRSSIVRVCRVNDVSGVGTYDWCINAATDPALPAKGSPHPHPNFAHLVLLDRRAQPDPTHDNSAIVRLVYGPDTVEAVETSPPEWEIDQVETEVETSFDRNGALIVVNYIPPGTPTPPAIPQTGTIRTTIMTTRLRGKRTESTNPYSRINTHGGTTNALSWGPFGLLDPPRSWKLKMAARTADGGATFEVSYELTRELERIDPEVRYLAQDGNPPPDITPANGIAFPEVRPQSDWTVLALI